MVRVIDGGCETHEWGEWGAWVSVTMDAAKRRRICLHCLARETEFRYLGENKRVVQEGKNHG